MNEKEAAFLGFPSGTGEFDYLGFLRSLWRSVFLSSGHLIIDLSF